MTASTLKYWHEIRNPDSFFFTRKTMRFFGDTMKNYGVRKSGELWELYRKRPVKCGLQNSTFFDPVCFKRVNPPI